VRKETEDCQVLSANLASLDLRVQREVKDLEEKLGPWAHLVIKERLVRQAFLGIQEVLVKKVTKDNKVVMVYRVPKERGDEMVQLENVVKLGLVALEESEGEEEARDSPELKVTRVSQDHLGLLDLRDRMVLKV